MVGRVVGGQLEAIRNGPEQSSEKSPTKGAARAAQPSRLRRAPFGRTRSLFTSMSR